MQNLWSFRYLTEMKEVFFTLRAFPKHFNFSLFTHIFHCKTIFESKGKDSPLLLLLVIKGILVHVYDFGAISGGSEQQVSTDCCSLDCSLLHKRILIDLHQPCIPLSSSSSSSLHVLAARRCENEWGVIQPFRTRQEKHAQVFARDRSFS